MTEQEKIIKEQTKDAIEVLGFLKKDFENKAKPRCKFARVRAGLFFGIKALEKQIAKKPSEVNEKQDGLFYVLSFMCPSCNEPVIGQPYKPKHCKHCGQKLDWE